MEASYAENTWKKYSGAWKRFEAWCVDENIVNIKPCEPLTVALYLSHLELKSSLRGAITGAVEGIRWAHESAGLASPTDVPFVKRIYEGAKRISPVNRNKKDPVKIEYVEELLRGVDQEKLSDLRFAVLLTLSFAGFFRISEILNFRVRDLTFESDAVKFFVRKAKNDQPAEGKFVFVARTPNFTCPIAILEKYLRKARIVDPDDYVIAHLKKDSNGAWIGEAKTPLSYSRARQILMEKFQPITDKVPEFNFGTHSGRIGGATTAKEAGVEDRLLDEHGRWKNPQSKNRYIRDSRSKKLAASKSLGL